MSLPFEGFLALRYFRPRRTFVSVITMISVLGVMLGVAVLIIVIAVMSGFDREWHTRILGVDSHLKIFKLSGDNEIPLAGYEDVLKRISKVPKVKGAAPFIAGQVMLQTEPSTGNSLTIAPRILGLDAELERNVSVLPFRVVRGEYNLKGHGILMGTELARSLKISVGDRVAVYSPATIEKWQKTKGQETVLPDDYTVSGIFDVGYSDFNSSIVVVSLENAQDLYALPADMIHGIRITLNDPYQANAVSNSLTEALGSGYKMVTWDAERPEIFNALAVEKNMMFYLLFFIMIVAAFGIVNCQITFVVQKTREIGVLKALGATNGQVLTIFLSQSIVVGGLGVSLGLALAAVALHYRNPFLALMNRLTGFELLPASIYQIYELPASIEPGDVALICGMAFMACVLAGIFPAWKAGRLQPVEALRND